MRADVEPGGDGLPRCPWAWGDPAMAAYHDAEWGTPCRDDRALFELLILEGFQAGLSWSTILRKREAFRRAFDAFDPERVAAYGEADAARLLADPGIVRNRQKVAATIGNARGWLALAEEHGSPGDWLWRFAPAQRVRQPRPLALTDVPATTPESEAMSAALRKRGFRFVGPTICYAFMQASGMVDDHLDGCFRAAVTDPAAPPPPD